MHTAKAHYDEHLAAVYEWMTGGFENSSERNREFFKKLELDNLPRGLAVDLGAGLGYQSIPLAELGFRVIAVDFSADLLGQLKTYAGNLPIQIVEDDILNFTGYLENEAELIVCMGDTLTHLKSFEDVWKLLSDIEESLLDNGNLILTFRDYFSRELSDNHRFIPVRSDNEKIFTCFLEYFENYVKVHDILYTKEFSEWHFSVSSYPKLRLDPKAVEQRLRDLAFSSVNKEIENGMVKIIAIK